MDSEEDLADSAADLEGFDTEGSEDFDTGDSEGSEVDTGVGSELELEFMEVEEAGLVDTPDIPVIWNRSSVMRG